MRGLAQKCKAHNHNTINDVSSNMYIAQEHVRTHINDLSSNMFLGNILNLNLLRSWERVLGLVGFGECYYLSIDGACTWPAANRHLNDYGDFYCFLQLATKTYRMSKIIFWQLLILYPNTNLSLSKKDSLLHPDGMICFFIYTFGFVLWINI